MEDLIMATKKTRTNFLILNWHRFRRGRFYKRGLWGSNSRIFFGELHSTLVNLSDCEQADLFLLDCNQELGALMVQFHEKMRLVNENLDRWLILPKKEARDENQTAEQSAQDFMGGQVDYASSNLLVQLLAENSCTAMEHERQRHRH